MAAAAAASGGTDAVISAADNPTNELAVRVWNANNHQVTFGVLGATVHALLEYMMLNGWESVAFDIYDGKNIVGGGSVG